MGLSFHCQRSHFSTSSERYKRFPSLLISVTGFANLSNWFERDAQSSEEFVTIFIDQKSVLDALYEQLNANAENFGMFVSLSNDSKIKEITNLGLLTPTSERNIWCIKIMEMKLQNMPSVQQKFPFPISPLYPKGNILETLLLQGPSSLPSPLVIKESYDQMLDSANEYKDIPWNLNLLDLGIDNSFASATTMPTTSPEKVLKTIDPIEFLTDRYFTTLYSNSTIVEHFVKSSLPKMQLLRRDNTKLAIDCLSKLVVESLSDFDRRHDIPMESMKLEDFKMIWLSREKCLDDTEESFRRHHLHRLGFTENVGILDPEKLGSFIDDIKLKDLKLQILLDLELLKIIKQENEGGKTDKRKSRPQSGSQMEIRPSLSSKRFSTSLVGKKKRLIPTLLGTVIPTSMDFDVDLRIDQTVDENKLMTVEGVEKLIKILFDKLCVYDAIMGLDYKDVNSSWGFLSNCVIPFFEKNHRRLLKTLAIKSRGPALSLKIKSRQEKKQRQEKRKEKLQKDKVLKKNGSSTERKAASIDLSKIKLKRSHSSFGNPTADFSRKTFSMVKSASIVSSMTESGLIDDLMQTKETNSLGAATVSDVKGFMNSKKRKLQAPKKKSARLEAATSSISKEEVNLSRITHDPHDIESELFRPNQIIEATPRKPASFRSGNGSVNVLSVTSPHQGKSALRENNKARVLDSVITTQISETPALERVQVRPGVFEIGSSPLKSGGLSQSKRADENLHLVVGTPRHGVIVSSPASVKLSVTALKTPAKSTKRKLDFN